MLQCLISIFIIICWISCSMNYLLQFSIHIMSAENVIQAMYAAFMLIQTRTCVCEVNAILRCISPTWSTFVQSTLRSHHMHHSRLQKCTAHFNRSYIHVPDPTFFPVQNVYENVLLFHKIYFPIFLWVWIYTENVVPTTLENSIKNASFHSSSSSMPA